MRKPPSRSRHARGKVIVVDDWRDAAARRRDGPGRNRRQGPRGDWLRAARGLGPILVLLPLAAFTAVFFAGGAPESRALPQARGASAGAIDTVSVQFSRCGFGLRRNCVIDGDTIWLAGEKIRIADINTPETGTPGCPQEAQLGARATVRLTELLNEAPFALAPNPDGRDEDRYVRKLRLITRDGESLGDRLVDEGLAHPWRGYREDWC